MALFAHPCSKWYFKCVNTFVSPYAGVTWLDTAVRICVVCPCILCKSLVFLPLVSLRSLVVYPVWSFIYLFHLLSPPLTPYLYLISVSGPSILFLLSLCGHHSLVFQYQSHLCLVIHLLIVSFPRCSPLLLHYPSLSVLFKPQCFSFFLLVRLIPTCCSVCTCTIFLPPVPASFSLFPSVCSMIFWFLTPACILDCLLDFRVFLYLCPNCTDYLVIGLCLCTGFRSLLAPVLIDASCVECNRTVSVCWWLSPFFRHQFWPLLLSKGNHNTHTHIHTYTHC